MSAVADIFARAWQHHQANDLPRAEQLYREVLSKDVSHADAWCFLGAACQSQGKTGEAEAAYRRALSALPNHASALNCLGVLLAEKGRLDESTTCFQQAVAYHPGDAEAHNNLGQAQARQGRIREAIACYHRALDLSPNFAPARSNLDIALRQIGGPQQQSWLGTPGNIALGTHGTVNQGVRGTGRVDAQAAYAANLRGVEFAKQGRLEEARTEFEQALRFEPDNPDSHNNLGNIFDMLGRIDDAATCYNRALRVRPDYVEANYNLGIVRAKQGKLDEACNCYLEAIRLRPDHVDAHNNLGIALLEQGRLEEAARWLRRGLALKPSYADAWNNLGNVLEQQGELEQACQSYQEAMRHQPHGATAYNNLANVRKQQGRLSDALASYDEAVKRDPEFAEAHFNRALLWLLMGNWTEGWPEYDWRWKTKDFPRHTFKQPRWTGEPLVGRTLLVLAEQGLGDTIQFIRFVAKLRQLGGRVIVQCHAPLRPLLADCAGLDDLVLAGAPLPHFDLYAPLMSLPGILGVMPDSVPAEVPYIQAQAKLVEHWRKELEPLKGLKVGISWQGRPTYRGDRLRSIPLAQFTRLGDVPGVRLISLQKGAGRDQLQEFPNSVDILDLGSRLDEQTGAFMETAAVMMNLDLVISSDTAVVHLAGALGAPVWVALNLIPDWRWLLHREDTPWYPSMRLFRQLEYGRWDDVFVRMSQELKTLASRLAN